LRKVKNRLLDTAYAATHLGHVLSSDEQLRADLVLEQFLNLDAERRGWGIRWEVTREKIGTERVSVPGGARNFNIRRGAISLVERWPGAIDQAALAALAAKPATYSLPWIFLRLLRLGLEPLVDEAEFRAKAADEYRRIRKNAVGADFIDLMDRIDLLTREYERVRIAELDRLKGKAEVWKWALWRQGIEGVVPTFWPMRRGVSPQVQYHYISRIPLKDYSQPCHLRLKRGGWLDCFRQKAASLVSYVAITPALAAHYLVREVVPESTQRRLERIGRLYKLNCWFDYLGRVPRDKRKASGVGFSYDQQKADAGNAAGGEGARPDLAALERQHEEQLKKGLDSDIRHAPQGGTVKISHPAPAIRHAELKRDMAIYNDSHGSYWNNSNIRVLRLPNSAAALAGLPEREIYPHRFDRGSLTGHLIGTLNILADNADNVEQWKNTTTKHKESLHVRKSGSESGFLGANAKCDGSDRRMPTAGDAKANLRTAAAARNCSGRQKPAHGQLFQPRSKRRARASSG
jgi:hypothetical protein